jgi:uncharacterized protein
MPGATPRTVTAVPYYAWANRGRGEMVTWIPTTNKSQLTTNK